LILLVCGLLVSAAVPALTIYRIELVGGGVVFAENEPKASGTTLVFRSSPQSILVALRRSDVARVEQIEADNKPPVDLGKATLKQVAAPNSNAARARIRASEKLFVDAGGAGSSDEILSWAPKMSAYRGYPWGDDQPGNRVAFPVSRDDLLPGNYRPFPVGRGGQSGDPPMIQEGRGLPKAGSLQEPPKAMLFPDPPSTANVQAPAAPLVFSERPHTDEVLSPPAAVIVGR
jgi:hypothetical protein